MPSSVVIPFSFSQAVIEWHNRQMKGPLQCMPSTAMSSTSVGWMELGSLRLCALFNHYPYLKAQSILKFLNILIIKISVLQYIKVLYFQCKEKKGNRFIFLKPTSSSAKFRLFNYSLRGNKPTDCLLMKLMQNLINTLSRQYSFRPFQ